MSLPQPSPDSGAEPIVVSDLLFDLIEFGLSGPLTNSGSLRDLLSTLRGIVPGLQIGRTSASGSVTVSLDVPFSNEDGIVMPPIRLELSLTTSTPSNVTVLGNSSIRLNGLHMLRADLGAADSGDPGLDGGVNVIGPFHGRGGHLFRRQMELVQQAIDRVGEVLRAAARYEKSLRYVDLRIRRAEACCDRNVPDARQITQYLKRVMLSGRRERRIDLYRLGAGEDVVKRSTVSHWIRSPLSPKAKAYAKRSDLLRAEITCPNRNSIRGMIAEAGTTRLDGNQAAGQLRALAVVLKPQLDDLLENLAEVEAEAPGVRPSMLLVALLPLTQFASGQGTASRGARPNPKTVAEAGVALDTLIGQGAYHCREPSCGALRSVLDKLAVLGGPLVRRGRSVIFVLAPRYAVALEAIAARTE